MGLGQWWWWGGEGGRGSGGGPGKSCASSLPPPPRLETKKLNTKLVVAGWRHSLGVREREPCSALAARNLLSVPAR